MAYHFPPIGGGGVQRSLKFAKYLPDFGILPIILTGSGKAEGRWTPDDRTMLSELPTDIPICRVQDWEKDRASLVAAGEAAVAQYKPQCIVASMSPFQDAPIAAELSRRLRIPWIADLRDPWALDEFQVHSTRWHRAREHRKMARFLCSASSVIMNTPEAAHRFRGAFASLADKAQVSITNGYDAADFTSKTIPPRPGKFIIVHSGYFHSEIGLHQKRHALQYRLLGRAERRVSLLPRSHFFLLQALECWRHSDPTIAENVRLICVGSLTETDRQLVQQSPVKDLVELTGYLPHSDCLNYVREADLLFLPMQKLPPGRRATIVPGKTYEYIASGRPILAAVPEGDAKDFVLQAGTGLCCGPDDVAAMVNILRSRYAAWLSGAPALPWNRSWVERFERRCLTAELATEIDRALHQ